LPELSRRPYLLRAMHEWMIDCGHTPHVIVDATQDGVEVPKAFVTDGRIVLNLSPGATQGLSLGADLVEFSARFSGNAHYIRIPLNAVLGIYARETGEGMVFQEEGPTAPGPETPAPGDGPRGGPSGGGGGGKPAAAPAAKRPTLKVVK
jgi:stringent starvation protein B